MSTNTHANSDYPLAAVQFSRLTRRGIILGLSLPQLIVLAVALLIVVAGLYTNGSAGLAWSSPAWASLVAVAPEAAPVAPTVPAEDRTAPDAV